MGDLGEDGFSFFLMPEFKVQNSRFKQTLARLSKISMQNSKFIVALGIVPDATQLSPYRRK